MEILATEWRAWIYPALLLLGAGLAGLVLQFILVVVLRSLGRRLESVALVSLVRRCARPVSLLLPVLLMNLAAPLAFAGKILVGVRQSLTVLLILSGAWLLIRLTTVFQDVISDRLRIDVADNLEARRLQTQFRILRQVMIFVIGVLALSAILMNFEPLRRLGTTLLASAGIAGIVVGFAAQRTLANLIAGFQIALTQPIRIDDVVIVEGEWGRIEEFTLTYVVVRIWDLRRLIVPISYFLEKPFQNWTHTSADIMGTVYLYADYTVPLEAVRQELHRIVQASEHWDGKVCGLSVTNATEKTVELRALVSAADSGHAWDLRCEVREKLITFLQQNHPDSLPRIRAELEQSATAAKD
jgi:small-conductance mechanosensitive channel